jgi:hypothetical protein
MDESNRVLAVLKYDEFDSFKREALLTRLPRLHAETVKGRLKTGHGWALENRPVDMV